VITVGVRHVSRLPLVMYIHNAVNVDRSSVCQGGKVSFVRSKGLYSKLRLDSLGIEGE
jgi:hypothetical protein